MSRAQRSIARFVALGALVVASLSTSSCGNGDFDPATLVSTVRVLASRADKPYAKPGDTVNIEVLAYDGRPDTTRPMKLYWIPLPCVNPKNDAYFACFASFANAAGAGGAPSGGAPSDAGADGGGPRVPPGGLGSVFKPGVDLTPYLPVGPTYQLTLPKDIITSHPVVQGASAPYGLEMIFNMACAGHVELVERDAQDPQSIPIGCFDDAHNKLGPDDYVFGFTRVYAYDQRTNANPQISGLTFDDKPVDMTAGITVDHCTTADKKDCPKTSIDVQVPDSSQEISPDDFDPNGGQLKEEVWAAYFSTGGRFDDEIRVLYDPRLGKVDGTATKFQAPQQPGDGLLWVVVHDSRSGAVWVQIPLHAK